MATYGYWIKDEEGRVIGKDSGVIGEGEGMTHIVAEYEALIQLLTYLRQLNMTDQPLEIRSDNMQLVKQMKGEWKVRGGSYVTRYASAVKLAAEFASVTYSWIPGELNQEADELTRVAYRLFLHERGGRKNFELISKH